MRHIITLLALILVGALSACTPAPKPDAASPALWQIDGPRGERGWLFGTIHALDKPAQWQSAKINAALTDANVLVLEISPKENGAAAADIFAQMSKSPGLPPLRERVLPTLRNRLDQLIKQSGQTSDQLSENETWAVALILSRTQEQGTKAKYGSEDDLADTWNKKRVAALETATQQFAMFDQLPEQDQRDLLAAVLSDDATDADLAKAWREGDMALLEKSMTKGLLADPELRAMLYTNRNRAWAITIADMLTRRERPFIAVGAAHMVGDEALPLLLRAQGYTITRLQ